MALAPLVDGDLVTLIEQVIQDEQEKYIGKHGDNCKENEEQDGGVEFTPRSLFVAWHGVLTLALRGWPRVISRMKHEVSKQASKLGLAPNENAGSTWPKLTLAARSRSAAALTLSELSELTSIAEKWSQRLTQVLVVSNVSVVLFARRRIDRVIMTSHWRLPGQRACLEEESSRELVDSILEEAKDLESYLCRAAMQGCNDHHYERPWTEASLVAFLDSQRPENLSLCSILEEFRAEVDQRWPGVYVWNQMKSLHITLRSLEYRPT